MFQQKAPPLKTAGNVSVQTECGFEIATPVLMLTPSELSLDFKASAADLEVPVHENVKCEDGVTRQVCFIRDESAPRRATYFYRQFTNLGIPKLQAADCVVEKQAAACFTKHCTVNASERLPVMKPFTPTFLHIPTLGAVQKKARQLWDMKQKVEGAALGGVGAAAQRPSIRDPRDAMFRGAGLHDDVDERTGLAKMLCGKRKAAGTPASAARPTRQPRVSAAAGGSGSSAPARSGSKQDVQSIDRQVAEANSELTADDPADHDAILAIVRGAGDARRFNGVRDLVVSEPFVRHLCHAMSDSCVMQVQAQGDYSFKSTAGVPARETPRPDQG